MDDLVKARIEAVRELRALGALHVRISADVLEVVFETGAPMSANSTTSDERPEPGETPEEAKARHDRTLFASAD